MAPRKRPGHKRAYRAKRKLNYRRRRTGKPSRTIVRGAGKVFNDRYFCKLRYDHVGSIAGAVSQYIQWCHNSAYDPYYPVGGGQPMGFDQLSTLYKRYRVHSCSLEITVMNLSSIPVEAFIYPLTSNAVPAGIESDREQRYSTFRIISAVAAGGYGTIKNRISTKKLWGVPSITLNPDFDASTSASPVNLGIFNFSLYSSDGVTNLNCPYNAKLTYNIEFFDPVRLARS